MKNALYIVDDHSIVRHGLKDWLEANSSWKVINTFTTSADCLKTLETTLTQDYPEIIIIDVQLIGETGFSLCKKLKEKYKDIKCVIYSMYDTPGYILQAKDSGAIGYVSKVASEQELIKCLEKVQKGEFYLEQKMIEAQTKLETITNIFSKQERLVFELILQRKSNDDIVEELFISNRTVENYISRIYDKLDVKNRSELLKKYGDIGK